MTGRERGCEEDSRLCVCMCVCVRDREVSRDSKRIRQTSVSWSVWTHDPDLY